jgi:ABC-type Mn2+/Zn2+ transport system ATPase subunit
MAGPAMLFCTLVEKDPRDGKVWVNESLQRMAYEWRELLKTGGLEASVYDISDATAKRMLVGARPHPAAPARQDGSIGRRDAMSERIIIVGGGVMGLATAWQLVRRGERWAVMGENGAGKTTLLKMIVGNVQPDAGSITVGGSVSLGYFAQHQMEQLDGDHTVLEELQAHAPMTGQGSLRNLAGAFSFQGDDVDKPVRVLSGGEKARLALAKILFDAPNFLVLDEPTNHLDIVTKRALVRSLGNYEGTVVFVSHDRAFLRAVATRVLELTPAGPHLYGGTYDEYVASTGREAPGMRQH